MDTAWARAQLMEFQQMIELVPAAPTPATTRGPGGMMTARPEGEIVSAATVVEQILDRLLPDWRSFRGRGIDGWSGHREATQRALSVLDLDEKLQANLGDTTPRLDASRLHPWVWEGARSLWQSKHYAEAVGAAASKVNAETQNKVGRRDVSERDLFQQAFTTNPPNPGTPRLRLEDDDGSTTFQSRHRGAMAFAEGCFSALRHPGSHDRQHELPEHEALERLAAFSLLARWVDTAVVVA